GDYRQQSVPIEATEAPYETDATKASYGGSTVVEDDLFDDLLSEEPQREETETPPVERALGLDVSQYQSGIEWQLVAPNGISFAFIKASQGDSRADSMFADHWAGAKDAGILRGAYHVFEPGLSPTLQAEHFYKTVAQTGDFGELPPVLDMEKTSSSAEKIREYLSEIERLFGKKPVIYTRAMVWDSLGPTPWAEA
ncbi:MAG: hypothetical protein GY803_21895, partial [Chloroflexi bacterium]|nr:hypothetical protein [Chloroflexota bacterium]